MHVVRHIISSPEYHIRLNMLFDVVTHCCNRVNGDVTMVITQRPCLFALLLGEAVLLSAADNRTAVVSSSCAVLHV